MISRRYHQNVRSTGVCPLFVVRLAHHTSSPEVTGSLTELNRTLMSPEIYSSSTAGVMRASKTPETTGGKLSPPGYPVKRPLDFHQGAHRPLRRSEGRLMGTEQHSLPAEEPGHVRRSSP